MTVAAVCAVVGAAVVTVQPSAAAQTACTTTQGTGWTATLCLSALVDGPATGPVQVATTVDVSAGGPRVAKAEFALRDAYLLTDYEAPYAFTLDTADVVDGAATLRAQLVFRDGTISDPTSVDLVLTNGVSTPPTPTGSWSPPTRPPATQTDPLVVAAVGDGAGGETAATDVTNMIAAWQPEMMTYLGDVYDDGTITEFRNWYGDSTHWYGRFKDITAPVIGNHEYNKNASGAFEADGYFRYWNNIPHHYSYDAGGWHFVSIDSTTQYNQTATGTAQFDWLVQDLANRTNPCTVVLWHHPLNTVGSEGPSQRMAAMWQVLRQNNVTLVLNGHDHQYQHWMPLDGNQQPDPDGVTEMVSGAGGHSSQSITGSDPRVVATHQAYGALRLEVFPDRVDYTYRTPNGSTGKVLDTGFVRCTALPADTQPPTRPSGLTATLQTTGTATYSADLAWNAATDDRGVAQYRVRQGASVLATLPSGTRTYTAINLASSTTYAFTVSALDAAGNESPVSTPPASVTTPAPTPVTEVAATDADAYTTEQQPTKNYGKATALRLDADPSTNSYVRFTVSGSHPNVTSAHLRLWATAKNTAGVQVRTVPTTWGETTITAANAPTAGPLVATSGSVTSGTWVDVPVTSTVVGNGTYAFKLSTTGTTASTLASREAGASTTAQLVVNSQPPPDTQPPTVPGNVNAAAPSQNHVDVTWTASTDNDAVSYYTVYRDGVAKDTVVGSQRAYVDTDVNAGRAYTYAVDAVDPAGNRSARSATAAVTPPDETPPELPDPFDVVLTGPTTVSIRWGASTDNVGITGYRLKRDNPTIAQLPASATSYDDDTVKAGKTYTYALSATDASGNRSDAVTASITVPRDNGGSPPTTPGNVTATATGERTVNVEWTASTDDTALSGYEIFRDDVSAGLVGASATSWNDTGRAPATTYSYTVRAIDENANFSLLSSPPATATTWALDTTAPSVPGGVQAAGASLTSIGVTWTSSTDDRGVTGYRLYRDGTQLGGDLPADATSFTDTGLVTGSTHAYEVDAVDAAGNRSARSAAVSARTQVPAPSTQTFQVGADAYVNSASPGSKYGTTTTLRLDGDPVVSSYLRFTTSSLQPVVTSAVLRVYANARNTSTVQARTTSTTWDEATISWTTAPAPGAVAGSAGPTAAAGWVDIPVTATITGNGTYSFVLNQPGVTAVAFQSKEAGAPTAAVLVVTSSY
ncbi:DNRLRE domain-containing protein [Oryzobacter telluris]|uniref:CBM96 family carbohydrate-binding protein n=1 Tax=Oryzobacter telluris TaxID=3149179 RepID=UPI00370DB8EE